MRVLDAADTAALLPLRPLMDALCDVLREYGAGLVACPERLVVPSGDGVLLSMPCRGSDLLVHKLVTVFGGNAACGLPAIQGQVTALDAATGTPLFALDGPVVTARRTAAVTMVAVEALRSVPPSTALLIGTGSQAAAHLSALREVLPGLLVAVRGRQPGAAERFCRTHAGAEPAGPDADAELVIAATSSLEPVFDRSPDPTRLVCGIGAYRLDMREIGARLIRGSQVYVDDPVGAPGEAGDVHAAGVAWREVRSLARALDEPPDQARAVFFKSVGCAAWDLAACRTARAALSQ